MSSYERKIVPISFNIEQQRELLCVMDHLGVDTMSGAVKMILKRYIRENDLHPEDMKFRTRAEDIEKTIGKW